MNNILSNCIAKLLLNPSPNITVGEEIAQGSMAAVSVPAKQEQIGIWSFIKTQVAPAGLQSSLRQCTGQRALDAQ